MRHVFLFFLLLPILASAKERPNIVLIFTDDQGWNDVGCYGSEIPTPNIDRLGMEGARFTQFYSASSICTPSRFGLLTGRNPVRSNHQLLSALMFMAEEHKTTGLQEHETTIAEILREKAGYDTALIGKWHLGHGSPALLPLNHGFSFFRGHTGGCIDFFTMTYGNIPDWYHDNERSTENGYATELITEEAVEYLSTRRASDNPFFLYLAYNAPHFGKGFNPKTKEPVNLMQAQGDDLKRVSFIEDRIRREFAAMTVSLDDGVGKVMEALRKEELDEDTLVIFLTDHGGDPTYGGSNVPLRGQKATLFDGGIRVPCLMRWPKMIDPGQIVDSPAWALDLFPTFCELAGVADYESEMLDGNDLSGWITGKDKLPSDREMYWETGAHSELGRKGWRAYRSDSFKYVHSPKEGDFLFDLSKDPHETTNLADSDKERFTKWKQRADFLAQQYRESAKKP